MAKSAFSYFMMRDDEIAGTIGVFFPSPTIFLSPLQGTQFTCFTSTKVQILTQKTLTGDTVESWNINIKLKASYASSLRPHTLVA